MQGIPDDWRSYDDEQKAALIRRLEAVKYSSGLKVRPWRSTARNKQLPPDDPKHHYADSNGYRCSDAKCISNTTDTDYRIWLWCGARGSGKTQCGSNWILEQALRHPDTKWGVAAPTASELDSVVFNEESGILRQALPGDIAEIRPGVLDVNQNKSRIRLSNGSVIQGYSADRPDRIRGANLHGLWWDEAMASRYQQEFWLVARPAVRRGSARILITTTPRATPLLRSLAGREDVHLTTGRMVENTHLHPDVVDGLLREFGGTRRGKEELDGEILSDFEGALFRREDLDAGRLEPGEPIPFMARVVVGLDPAMKAGETSDESGIVVVGEVPSPDGSGAAYVLDDRSLRGTPGEVAKAACAAAERWGADCIVVEGNQGGDWITNTLRSVNPAIRIRLVHARRNKVIRAEPVGALAEQGRLKLCGVFPELEDQLACLIPGEVPLRSPDRADALVWAVFELRQLSQPSYLSAYGLRPCPSCGTAVRKEAESCPDCHEILTVADPAPVAETSPDPQTRWSRAYQKMCGSGHLYPKSAKSCPDCVMDPEEFFRQLDKWTGTGGKLLTGKELALMWHHGGYR